MCLLYCPGVFANKLVAAVVWCYSYALTFNSAAAHGRVACMYLHYYRGVFAG
jgi:hypothetical protein